MPGLNNYIRTNWQTGDVVDAVKLNNIEEQVESVTNTLLDNGTASVFSTTSKYALRDLVLYEGYIYKCVNPVTTAGDWTGEENWERTNLGAEMVSIKHTINTALEETSAAIANKADKNEISAQSEEIANLKSDLNNITTGTTSDKGKALKVKTVINGKVTEWEFGEISAGGEGGEIGVSDDLKLALLQLASKVAYIDEDGQNYYDDLRDALYPPVPATGISLSSNTLFFSALNSSQTLIATLTPSDSTDIVTWSSSNTSVVTVDNGVVTSAGNGSATITAAAGSVSATCTVTVSVLILQSINATYTQSRPIYNTSSLDSLKNDLVVTALWNDGTTSTVTSADYLLSGTLITGTSVITVSYGGMTDTFSVTVTDSSTPMPSGYTLKSYVQSNGDAYIDTGYRVIAGTTSVPFTKSFECKFAVSAVSVNKNLFGYQGTHDAVSDYRFMPFIRVNDGNLYYYGQDSGASSAVQGWEPSGINEISVDFYGYVNGYIGGDYPVFIVNGVQTTGDKKRPLSYSNEQGTVYLCAQNYKASGPATADTTVDGGYIRCYGFKIQEREFGTGDETVVMNFKPCVRNSDGVAGFYETVNGVFYPSIGGNAFVAGD